MVKPIADYSDEAETHKALMVLRFFYIVLATGGFALFGVAQMDKIALPLIFLSIISFISMRYIQLMRKIYEIKEETIESINWNRKEFPLSNQNHVGKKG